MDDILTTNSIHEEVDIADLDYKLRQEKRGRKIYHQERVEDDKIKELDFT